MIEHGPIALPRSPPPIPKSQISRRMFGDDVIGLNFLMFDPSAKARCEHDLTMNVALAVSLLTQ
jgi:hypothetical protein